MTDENNAEDPPEKRGEILRGGAPAPEPVRTGTIAWLFSRLSRLSFRNRGYVRKLKTAQEVLEARKQLGKTYIEHEEVSGQVRDLPLTIEKQRFQRLREYFAEERQLTTELNDSVMEGKTRDKKNKLKQGEIEIQEIEQEKKLLRAKKERDELKNPPPASAAPPPVDKMKLRERAYAKRDKTIKRIEKQTNATPQTKRDLKKAAENELEEELRKIDQMP
jgi:hypothetical protein